MADELTAQELMTKFNGSPWCDTCKQGACFNETVGNRHTSQEWPFGIPSHLDPNNDHEITFKEWWATPGWLS